METIGERIKKVRKLTGMTAKQFSERIGINPNTYGKYEPGNANPTDAFIKLMCIKTGVSEQWLRTGEGTMYEDGREEPKETVGDRLEMVRRTMGLTQAEFTDTLGINKSTYSKYEINYSNPPDAVIRTVCLTLGVDEHWLRTGEGSMGGIKTDRSGGYSAAEERALKTAYMVLEEIQKEVREATGIDRMRSLCETLATVSDFLRMLERMKTE